MNKEGWEDQVPYHIDIVINLAGATLNKRWTDEYKQTLMLSRIQATQALYELFAHKGKFPEILFNASAVGYSRPDIHLTYTELSPCDPPYFLSDITYHWERFARKFEQPQPRFILGVFGMGRSEQGPALPEWGLPFRFYAGG
ncbi:TIGR01777 family oxidoreductase, partial [Staphylococcus simulans]